MELVTIEIAQKLKTKGFPQGNEDDITKLYYRISDNLQSAIMLSEGKDVKWYCPTIGEVLKWLRDTHNIHINVGFVRFNGNTELYWVFSVENIKDDVEYDWLYSTSHDSYEEAIIAGIEYVLDNLI
jgi:hypothetical protein